MIERVRCEGAPRDLGLDQGIACREAIRAELGALGGFWWRALGARLGLGLAAPLVALARDLGRHFPHLAERTAGLAAGAGVPIATLIAQLARELGSPEAAAVLDAGFARAEPAGLPEAEPAGIARNGPAGVWIALRSHRLLVVRAVRPDGGYSNLTVTRPGLAGALAGVNEAGLAAAAVPLGSPELGEHCEAPSALLAEGCLERLDAVEKALEWCERRPGGGRARLVFADVAGARGAVELEGEKRRRVEAPLGAPSAAAPSVRIDARARSLEIERPGAPALRVSLGGEG